MALRTQPRCVSARFWWWFQDAPAGDRADVSIVPVLGCMTDFFGGGRWEQEQTGNGEEILYPLLFHLLIWRPMQPLFPKASALTETVIAAAIEVHRDKGPGLIESIY